MKLLLAIIPEPWLSMGLLLGFLGTYILGSLDGSGTARQKARIESLEVDRARLLRQQNTALEIQTQMAVRLAELRAEDRRQEAETDALVEKLRADRRACTLSESSRLRLRSIRIGPQTRNP